MSDPSFCLILQDLSHMPVFVNGTSLSPLEKKVLSGLVSEHQSKLWSFCPWVFSPLTKKLFPMNMYKQVARWWINSIPTVSCLGAVIITQQITAYPAGTVFNVTSGAEELINSVSRHCIYCRLTSVGTWGAFLFHYPVSWSFVSKAEGGDGALQSLSETVPWLRWECAPPQLMCSVVAGS